jgi:squalene cyclase
VLSRAQAPEDRAIAYLAGEVREWPEKNHCFSCHNNGDGARALLIAMRHGKHVPPDALRDTLSWLARPSDWYIAAKNPAVSDKVLATIQFAAALTEVSVAQRAAVVKAAESLVSHQKPDGSWTIDEGSIGSPATYGPALATYMAIRALETPQNGDFSEPVERARAWLKRQKPASVSEAAAAMLAGVAHHSELLLAWQNSDGGWGPWAKTPSEAFDTGLALLALERYPAARSAVVKGRAFLIKTQQPPGGWPETTRPSGGQSYAQHISTSAWAAIALLETDSKRK